MRCLVSILLFFSAVSVEAQDTVCVIVYGKDRPESGIPNSGKVEEGCYVNNRKEGLWKKYHDDGKTPKIIGTYENNRPRGPYQKFHTNGMLKEKGCFVKNMYRDSLIRYYNTGVKEFEEFYDSTGRQQGWCYFYFPSGRLEASYFNKNGIPVGKYTRYYSNGDTMEVVIYNELGETVSSKSFKPIHPIEESQIPVRQNIGDPPSFNPNGYNKIFNEYGKVWQEGTFKNGALWEGKTYVYDKAGILLRVKVYSGGAYQSVLKTGIDSGMQK